MTSHILVCVSEVDILHPSYLPFQDPSECINHYFKLNVYYSPQVCILLHHRILGNIDINHTSSIQLCTYYYIPILLWACLIFLIDWKRLMTLVIESGEFNVSLIHGINITMVTFPCWCNIDIPCHLCHSMLIVSPTHKKLLTSLLTYTMHDLSKI